MSPQELYPFRFRDPVTGKWVRARYRARHDEIRERYAEWELAGPAEIRFAAGAMFDPDRKRGMHGDAMRSAEPPLELDPQLATPPAIDAGEARLARLFLRRYVTWCARRRRFAQMNGAARLYAELGARLAGSAR